MSIKIKDSLAATLSGNISGNAATATQLLTARNINGVSFDGTGNITITAAAGTLTGATLASGVTASSLTSVGTLTDLTVTNAIVGSVTGSAATLTTPRNINGTAFDGSANITVTSAAGTLTGTTLNSSVVTSSLTSVGTLTSLTTSGQITSSLATGTAPFAVTSTTVNTNLNADKVDGLDASAFANLSGGVVTSANTATQHKTRYITLPLKSSALTAETIVVLPYLRHAATVIALHVWRLDGTSLTANAKYNTTSIWTSAQNHNGSADTVSTFGSPNNASIPAGAKISIVLASVTGTITEATITLEITMD